MNTNTNALILENNTTQNFKVTPESGVTNISNVAKVVSA